MSSLTQGSHFVSGYGVLTSFAFESVNTFCIYQCCIEGKHVALNCIYELMSAFDLLSSVSRILGCFLDVNSCQIFMLLVGSL